MQIKMCSKQRRCGPRRDVRTCASKMVALRVSIVRWVDDHQPGWVECQFADAQDRLWVIIEKAPVISAENLGPDSSYPRSAVIACQLIERRVDPGGQDLLLVDTSIPWGIEATSGETRFEVRAEQVVEMMNSPDEPARS